MDFLIASGNWDLAKDISWESYIKYDEVEFLHYYIRISHELNMYDNICKVANYVLDQKIYEFYYKAGYSLIQCNREHDAKKYFDKIFELIDSTSIIYPQHNQNVNVVIITKNPKLLKIDLSPFSLFHMAKFYIKIDDEKSCKLFKYALINIEYEINNKDNYNKITKINLT